MDEYAKLRALLDLVESAGIEIRRSPPGPNADGAGGALVRVRGREILFLDPTASAADRIAVVASALAGRTQIEEIYLPPEIRELIDAAGGHD